MQRTLVFVLDQALRLLHPMMPFVTDAIWRNVPVGTDDTAPSLMVAAWPVPRCSRRSRILAPRSRSRPCRRSSSPSAVCGRATASRQDPARRRRQGAGE